MSEKSKSKKILNIIVNVIVAVILVLVVFVMVNTIVAGNKGYTPYFGTTFVTVQSPSMEKDSVTGEVGEENFNTSHLLIVKLLSDDEKKELQIGDVITFYADIDGDGIKNELITHRIYSIDRRTDGGITSLVTKGDNNLNPDAQTRYTTDIIGKYQGKIAGIGAVVKFLQSPWGFFGLAVIPSFLLVIYFGFILFKAVRDGKAEGDKERKAAEKEQMRQELLKELQAEGVAPVSAAKPIETAEVSEVGADESANATTDDADNKDKE